MSTCINCYHSIEEEKIKALPEARYCIACARKLNNKPQRRLAQPELLAGGWIPIKDSLTGGMELTINGSKRRKKLPLVLKDEVFDSGKIVQTLVGQGHRSKKSKKDKKSRGSVWRYDSGEQPNAGDVIYTETVSLAEHNHLWVVDSVETNCVQCHCETKGKESWIHTFYVRQMNLLFRKEETLEKK